MTHVLSHLTLPELHASFQTGIRLWRFCFQITASARLWRFKDFIACWSYLHFLSMPALCNLKRSQRKTCERIQRSMSSSSNHRQMTIIIQGSMMHKVPHFYLYTCVCRVYVECTCVPECVHECPSTCMWRWKNFVFSPSPLHFMRRGLPRNLKSLTCQTHWFLLPPSDPSPGPSVTDMLHDTWPLHGWRRSELKPWCLCRQHLCNLELHSKS